MIKNDILNSIESKFEDAIKTNKAAIDSGTCHYNPHLAVRKKHEEVGLHSNFLYSLFNPLGDHFRGSEFLYSFLRTINVIDDSEETKNKLAGAIVTREKHKIDLLIEAPDHWYIIENKIFASDQPSQINRYVHHIKMIEEKRKNSDISYDFRKISVIYLTLSGVKPSGKSLAEFQGEKKEKVPRLFMSTKDGIPLLLASYKQIQIWCSKCLTADYVTNSPALYYSIASYKQVLDRLLGEAAAGIPPLGKQYFPVKTNEDFFLSLTDAEKKVFIKAAVSSSDNSSYVFFNTSLVANRKIKIPRMLLQSIFNGILHKFREGVYSEAAMHGFVVANTRDGLGLNGKGIKLLGSSINWYTEKGKRTGKHQFMAFKPRNADDSYWYVIYFAKHAFYQGFIEIGSETKELKKFDRAIDGFKSHEYEPYKDKMVSTSLGIAHYDHKDFSIDAIKALTNPQKFFELVIKKSIVSFWGEHVVSLNGDTAKHFLTRQPIN